MKCRAEAVDLRLTLSGIFLIVLSFCQIQCSLNQRTKNLPTAFFRLCPLLQAIVMHTKKPDDSQLIANYPVFFMLRCAICRKGAALFVLESMDAAFGKKGLFHDAKFIF